MERIKYPAIFALALALSYLKDWRRLCNIAEGDVAYWSIEASEAETNSPAYWAATGRAKAALEREQHARKEATRALLELRELQDHQTVRSKRAAKLRRRAA